MAAEPGRLVAVSPHLDDAVLGCGELLAKHPGAVVVTVCAGIPRAASVLTQWDRSCGFSSAGEAMHARRREDAAALAVLDAVPCWLDFLDDQYGTAAEPHEIADALREVLLRQRPDIVAIPLGLFHRDHHRAHAAALRLLGTLPSARWLAYEEPIYSAVAKWRDERFRALHEAGVQCTALQPSDGADLGRKRRAIECYASQLRGLSTPGMPGWQCTLQPERYWELKPA